VRIFKKPFGDSKRHRRKEIPDGLWNKCPQCSHLMFRKALDENLKVCTKCGYHLSLSCWERLDMIADENSFIEMDTKLEPCDPLRFEGQKKYTAKLSEEQKKTGLKDAVITGQAKMDKIDIALAITDSRFIMGSMGSVVGEKIARIIELAARKRLKKKMSRLFQCLPILLWPG